MQAIVISLFAVLCVVSFIGIIRIRDGLDITDIVPRDTNQHSFLDAQSQYFGFYNFYAVTKVILLAVYHPYYYYYYYYETSKIIVS